MKIWNLRGQQNSISEALQVSLPEHAVVSFVGAGGKTSLIFAWARELTAEGKKVVVTTTTHMLHPAFAEDIYAGRAIIYYQNYSVKPDEDFSHIDSLLNEHRLLLLGTKDIENERKIVAAPSEIMNYAVKVADVILIEADGSRQMPLKWPKEHEPVVPEYTDLSICVAGLSSMGRPLDEAMYGAGHMPEAMSRPVIDEELIAAIVSSPDGGLKGTFGDYRVFLNQADTEEIQERAEYIQRLLAVRGIQSAWGCLH